MSHNLVEQLKKLKDFEGRINPDRIWVAQNREKLIGQVSNTIGEGPVRFNISMVWQSLQILLPGRIVYNVVRPIAIFVLVFAITASGWITTVGATQNSLPGDITYSVKVAVSKIAKGNVATATGIANDVKKVAENKDEKMSEKIVVGVGYLKKTLDSAEEEVKATATDKPEAVVEKVKEMNEAVKEINKELVNAKKELKETETTNPQAVATAIVVEEAKTLANESAQAVVEDVVQKAVDGKLGVDQQAVKEIVKDHIQTVLSHTDELKQEAKVVAEAVSSTLSMVASSTNSIATPIISTTTISTTGTASNATTTANVTELKNVAEQTAKAVSQNEEVTKKNLAEAEQMVNNNQLVEALQKVKEVNSVTVEVKQQVEQAGQAVKAVQQTVETQATSAPLAPVVNNVLSTGTVK